MHPGYLAGIDNMYRIFGKIYELSKSRFVILIVFPAKIQCFRFGRADMPLPGQDRVKQGLALQIVGWVTAKKFFIPKLF